uniref:WD repeat-containing protein 89 n=1 Tax=Zeugodacus cucurbitae TaxID=28588 RepID=A0A0A1WUE4_ZEUCU
MKGNINSRAEASYSRGGGYDDEWRDATPVVDDEDTCSAEELEGLFQIKCRIGGESAVSLEKVYVLHLAADSGFTRVAAGLSSSFVHIFDINAERTMQISSLTRIPTPQDNQILNVCGVRFLDDTPNCLLVGESEGSVHLFDLRTQREVARFEEDVECTQGFTNFRGGKNLGDRKTINCFDSNSNGRIICTGTEQSKGEVYLFFYDVRERKHLGGYFESHEDDITALRFHDTNPDLLCSGSIDGLINVFDIREETEDDALTTTFNTESSVQKLNWHKNIYEQDVISCITHTNDFHVYLAEEGDVVATFDRCQITAAAKRRNEANCNVVNAHSTANGDLFLLAGTNHIKGEVLRTLRFNKSLLPMADFIGNKQIVRSSIFEKKSGTLVTGGESGFVTLWTADSTSKDDGLLASCSSELKHKSKKSKKKTPY